MMFMIYFKKASLIQALAWVSAVHGHAYFLTIAFCIKKTSDEMTHQRQNGAKKHSEEELGWGGIKSACQRLS